MGQASGGAFLPGDDLQIGGSWNFLNNLTVTGTLTSGSGGGSFASPTITGTVAGSATYSTPTLTTPVVSTGLSASGSAANDFSASTGTFKTSSGTNTLSGTTALAANKNLSCASGTTSVDFSAGTGTFLTSSGANTLSGSVTIADATTPSLTTASGKTNTGFVLINGKTSGSTKLITADATAQAVVISTAAQTSGGSTLTIPDQVGVSSNFVFDTLAQSLTNKTLAVSTIFQPDKQLATQTFTSNATLTNLTGLSWAVAASGVYYFRCIVPLLTQTTTGGSQMAFKLTTATLTQVNFRVCQSTDTDNTGAVSTSFTSTTDQATWFNQKTTAFTYVWIEGMFTIGTAGTVAIQAAQNTSASGGDVTVFAGVSAQMIRTA